MKAIITAISIWPFLTIHSLSIPTYPLPNITVVPHTWHPTLFLLCAVNATELRLYIDKRLPVYKPFSNDTAYLLLSLSNTIVPLQPAFADAELSTVIVYKDKLYKSGLHLHFASALPALTGSFYAPMPYGYTFAKNMSISLNETAHTYQFTIADHTVRLNSMISWNPNEPININLTQTNL